MQRPSARRLGAAVAILGICLVLPQAPASAAGPPGGTAPLTDGTGATVPDSWIVTLEPGTDPDREAPGLARAAGGQVSHVYRHALHGFAFQGSAQVRGRLSHILRCGLFDFALPGLSCAVRSLCAKHIPRGA
jgi:hypothetical protein